MINKNKSFVTILLFVITCSLFVACQKKVVEVGSYDDSLNLDEYVNMSAHDWLSDAVLGSEVDTYQYLDIPSVSINVVLMSDNSFVKSIDEESYNICLDAAYDGLAKAFRDLIRKRMFVAELDGNITDEEIDSILMDEIGMPLDQYLREYGPKLLPSLEEIREDYDVSGAFVKEDTNE